MRLYGEGSRQFLSLGGHTGQTGMSFGGDEFPCAPQNQGDHWGISVFLHLKSLVPSSSGDPKSMVTGNGLVLNPSHPKLPTVKMGSYRPHLPKPTSVFFFFSDSSHRQAGKVIPVAFHEGVTSKVMCPQTHQEI